MTHWSFVREIQPGAYVIDDYDFENPSNELKVQHKIQRQFERADYEVYDYPGEYVKVPDGEQYVRTRLEELHAGFELAHGSTNARGFTVGHLFELTGQSRPDQDREYLIVQTRHELQFSEYEGMEGKGASYSCDFTVLCSKEPFRAATVTPKPIVQGPQTAVVVGPKGDEI